MSGSDELYSVIPYFLFIISIKFYENCKFWPAKIKQETAIIYMFIKTNHETKKKNPLNCKMVLRTDYILMSALQKKNAKKYTISLLSLVKKKVFSIIFPANKLFFLRFQRKRGRKVSFFMDYRSNCYTYVRLKTMLPSTATICEIGCGQLDPELCPNGFTKEAFKRRFIFACQQQIVSAFGPF